MNLGYANWFSAEEGGDLNGFSDYSGRIESIS